MDVDDDDDDDDDDGIVELGFVGLVSESRLAHPILFRFVGLKSSLFIFFPPALLPFLQDKENSNKNPNLHLF